MGMNSMQTETAGTRGSLMRREIAEIPDAVERLLRDGQAARQAAAADLRRAPPRFAISVARGSSDHVCTYLKYASELLLGLPMASVGPSIASIYGARLGLADSLCLAVSQSGQSPDIVEMTRAAARDGARTIAITNAAGSPLASAAHAVLDIHAGPERSVAATKTFVTSAVAGLCLLAAWKGDADLQAAIHRLPEHLARAVAINWPELRERIGAHPSLFTMGRGPAWAIAGEAALKFKETCQLHAESYSSAEILHGPVSIVGAGFPILAFAAGDAAEPGLVEVAGKVAAMGAQVFVTSDMAPPASRIAHVRTGHPLTDPLALIVSFYAMVERLALARGVDPDLPRHLRKVTQTL